MSTHGQGRMDDLLRKAARHRTITSLLAYWAATWTFKSVTGGSGGLVGMLVGFAAVGFVGVLLDAATKPEQSPPLVRLGRTLERWRLIRRPTDI